MLCGSAHVVRKNTPQQPADTRNFVGVGRVVGGGTNVGRTCGMWGFCRGCCGLKRGFRRAVADAILAPLGVLCFPVSSAIMAPCGAGLIKGVVFLNWNGIRCEQRACGVVADIQREVLGGGEQQWHLILEN